MSDDDATAVREAGEAREREREVLDTLRKDGTFDAFRRKLLDEATSKDELKARVAEALARSRTLASRDAARMTENELVDALREELEDELMTAFAKQAWEVMTDEGKGLGREIYEAAHAARERAEAAAERSGGGGD